MWFIFPVRNLLKFINIYNGPSYKVPVTKGHSLTRSQFAMQQIRLSYEKPIYRLLRKATTLTNLLHLCRRGGTLVRACLFECVRAYNHDNVNFVWKLGIIQSLESYQIQCNVSIQC